jgi:CheY-like chemotaxis protein
VPFKILWVDDQIDELRSHIVFLGEKGYEVDGAANGRDALEMLRRADYDAVLLDEMMPGMGGLETLEEIKRIREHIPVVMITKSEAEDLMTRAIGKRIDDYLVKPVSPLQVFSTLKRQLEARRLAGEQVTRDYLSHFAQVGERIGTARRPDDWVDIYVDLVNWGLDLHAYSDHGLLQTHAEQMAAADQALARYVREHYEGWVNGQDPPLLSPRVYETLIEPEVQAGGQVLWITIDCMRLDQWRLMEPLLEEYFRLEQRFYWSILPSATPYARNALFAGLYPLEISRRYPQYWQGSSAHEGSRNFHEPELLGEQLKRLRSSAADSYKYFKVSDSREADQLRKQLGSLGDIRLIASVYNFLDIVAHGRSQSQILKELAPDEAAFRSLMRSWFAHSSLFEVLREISRRPATVIITTDLGSMFCRRATLIKGNRDTSTNVRYKYGDNLGVDTKQVFLMKEPQRFMLPPNSAIENYAITTEGYYLIYPTNFHEYERLYRESFQHGGISLEEMICPLVVLRPR